MALVVVVVVVTVVLVGRQRVVGLAQVTRLDLLALHHRQMDLVVQPMECLLQIRHPFQALALAQRVQMEHHLNLQMVYHHHMVILDHLRLDLQIQTHLEIKDLLPLQGLRFLLPLTRIL